MEDLHKLIIYDVAASDMPHMPEVEKQVENLLSVGHS